MGPNALILGFFECWVLSQLFHSPLSHSSRSFLVSLCFSPDLLQMLRCRCKKKKKKQMQREPLHKKWAQIPQMAFKTCGRSWKVSWKGSSRSFLIQLPITWPHPLSSSLYYSHVTGRVFLKPWVHVPLASESLSFLIKKWILASEPDRLNLNPWR